VDQPLLLLFSFLNVPFLHLFLFLAQTFQPLPLHFLFVLLLLFYTLFTYDLVHLLSLKLILGGFYRLCQPLGLYMFRSSIDEATSCLSRFRSRIQVLLSIDKRQRLPESCRLVHCNSRTYRVRTIILSRKIDHLFQRKYLLLPFLILPRRNALPVWFLKYSLDHVPFN
jgi:hypothetical protein